MIALYSCLLGFGSADINASCFRSPTSFLWIGTSSTEMTERDEKSSFSWRSAKGLAHWRERWIVRCALGTLAYSFQFAHHESDDGLGVLALG